MPELKLPFFESMASATHGMMTPDVYFEYYRIGRDQSKLNIIDIGVGRSHDYFICAGN